MSAALVVTDSWRKTPEELQRHKGRKGVSTVGPALDQAFAEEASHRQPYPVEADPDLVEQWPQGREDEGPPPPQAESDDETWGPWRSEGREERGSASGGAEATPPTDGGPAARGKHSGRGRGCH